VTGRKQAQAEPDDRHASNRREHRLETETQHDAMLAAPALARQRAASGWGEDSRRDTDAVPLPLCARDVLPVGGIPRVHGDPPDHSSGSG
jgi:hypothetical protein